MISNNVNLINACSNEVEELLTNLEKSNIKIKLVLNEIHVESEFPLNSRQIKILKEKKPDIINYLKEFSESENSNVSELLIRLREGDPQKSLFLIHPIGGAVSCYWQLALQLKFSGEIWGLQAPGLDNPAVAIKTSVPEQAAVFKKLILDRAKPPYYLAGWSYGGVLALEIAIQLVKEGNEIAFIGLIDSNLTCLDPNSESPSEHYLIASFIRDLFSQNLSLERIILTLDLDNDQRLVAVYEKCQKSSYIPKNLSIELFIKLYQIFKTNTLAHKNYLPDNYLEKIYHYVANNSLEYSGVIKTNNWLAAKTKRLTVDVITGDHYSIMQFPHLQALIESIDDSLF